MPNTTLRKEILSKTKLIVVKIGSSVLVKDDNSHDKKVIRQLAQSVAKLRQRGIKVLAPL